MIQHNKNDCTHNSVSRQRLFSNFQPIIHSYYKHLCSKGPENSTCTSMVMVSIVNLETIQLKFYSKISDFNSGFTDAFQDFGLVAHSYLASDTFTKPTPPSCMHALISVL